MSEQKTINIAGTIVPKFLYGTAWKEDDTKRCVLEALGAGFRGIDTANQRKHYFEEEVGAALSEAFNQGFIKRSELFLQTKFTHLAGQDSRLPYDSNADIKTQVHQSFESSLKHLNTTYLDSYVLHGPSSWHTLAIEDWDAWSAMEEIHASGKVKLLGISNVNLEQVKELCRECKVKPSFVQNRCYAKKAWDKDIREYCYENGIYYQGFSLLTANTTIFDHPKFKEIVLRHKCLATQLIFAYALNSKMIALTGTTSAKHMKEDLAAYAISINEEDLRFLEAIGT